MAEEFNKDRFKQALREHESADNPAALSGFNKEGKRTSAKGMYQWLDSWDKYAKEKMGKPVSEMMPKNNSPEELARAREEQEAFFDIYFEDSLKKDVAKLEKLDTKGRFNKLQLAGMAHFAGLGAASKYVKTGQEGESTRTGINPGIEGFLKKLETRYYFSPPDPHPPRKQFVQTLPTEYPTSKSASLTETITPTPTPTPTPTTEPTPMPTPKPSPTPLTEVLSPPTPTPSRSPATAENPPDEEQQALMSRWTTLNEQIEKGDLPDNQMQRAIQQRDKLEEQINSYEGPTQKLDFTTPVPPADEEKPTTSTTDKEPSQEDKDKKNAQEDATHYITNTNKDIAEPESAEEMFKFLQGQVKTVDPDFQKKIADDLADLKAKREAAYQVLKDRQDRIETAEIMEMFGKAIGMIATGLYGMKHGVDLTGVQFNLSDWSKRYDRAVQDYNLEFKKLEGERKEVMDRHDTEKGRVEAENKQMAQFFIRDYFTRRSEYQSALNRAEKEEEKAAKAAKSADEKTRREAISNLKFLQSKIASRRSEILSGVADLERARAYENEEKRNNAIKKALTKIQAAKSLLPGVERKTAEQLSESHWYFWTKLSDEQLDKYTENLTNEVGEYTKKIDDITARVLQGPSGEGGGGKVRMRAPNGEEMDVDGANVEYYKSKGAVVVQ